MEVHEKRDQWENRTPCVTTVNIGQNEGDGRVANAQGGGDDTESHNSERIQICD